MAQNFNYATNNHPAYTQSNTDQTALFKLKYDKPSQNMYNSANVLQTQIKKRYDFTGKQKLTSVPLGFAGGFGTGSVPTSNSARYDQALILSHKVYQSVDIDRESIYAAKDEGAFVDATKEVVKKGVENAMRNMSRILYSDGSGELGRGYATGANVSGDGSVATPYIVEIASGTFIEAHFEEQDLVNINSETSNLEIVAVDAANRKISLVGTSVRLAALTGVGPFVAADKIYCQKSKDNDPLGLRKIRDFSLAGTGTLYNIAYQRRWRMYLKDAASAGINPDMMNQVWLGHEKSFGTGTKMIMTSYVQYQKILDFMEDQKTYNMPNKNLKGGLSFQGVEFMTPKGAIGIFYDRFCRDDEMWFLNPEYIAVHHRPGWGWFDDDGTVFLRTGNDSYNALYGGYYENLIVPTAHACIYGLAV